MKKIEGVLEAPPGHWVGDGFPVRSLFSYQQHGKSVSPFLLLDYAAPTAFEPSSAPRGVGAHPHRGFETVTVVYAGEVSHRDSAGGGGTITPGDVQWMTAGSGLVHDEFHSEAFTQKGGAIEMVQLWVNLPARHKMSPPRYQNLTRDAIPVVELGEGGKLRVIAGSFRGHSGPAETFFPLDVWDLTLDPGAQFSVPAADGRRLIVVLLEGAITVGGTTALDDVAAVILGPAGEGTELKAGAASRLLVLSGQPIDEPLAGYGPFVMNTEREIREAINDFNSGRFGSLAPEPAAGHRS
jgi:redox-sensitive bicupin YhaK (pirin superfamily)